MLSINQAARIINAAPQATTPAYRLGMLSAQLQELCVPEAMFVFIQDKRDFCEGYASVAGATLTTRQFLGGN